MEQEARKGGGGREVTRGIKVLRSVYRVAASKSGTNDIFRLGIGRCYCVEKNNKSSFKDKGQEWHRSFIFEPYAAASYIYTHRV